MGNIYWAPPTRVAEYAHNATKPFSNTGSMSKSCKPNVNRNTNNFCCILDKISFEEEILVGQQCRVDWVTKLVWWTKLKRLLKNTFFSGETLFNFFPPSPHSIWSGSEGHQRSILVSLTYIYHLWMMSRVKRHTLTVGLYCVDESWERGRLSFVANITLN